MIHLFLIMDVKLILSKHGISRTRFRTDLLNVFYKTKKSFSIEEVEENFTSINKATIYRALKHFEKKGLIHLVPTKNGLKKYALCNRKECSATAHNHNHGHFICYECDQTFCLDDVKSPDVSNLKGFHVKDLKLIVEGYCKECYQS